MITSDAKSGGFEVVPKYTSYLCPQGPPSHVSVRLSGCAVAAFRGFLYAGVVGPRGTKGLYSEGFVNVEFHRRSNEFTNH